MRQNKNTFRICKHDQQWRNVTFHFFKKFLLHGAYFLQRNQQLVFTIFKSDWNGYCTILFRPVTYPTKQHRSFQKVLSNENCCKMKTNTNKRMNSSLICVKDWCIVFHRKNFCQRMKTFFGILQKMRQIERCSKNDVFSKKCFKNPASQNNHVVISI